MYQNMEHSEQVYQQALVFNLVTIEQKQRKFYKFEPLPNPIVQALNTYQNISTPRTVIPSKHSNVIIRDIYEGPSYSGLSVDEFSSRIQEEYEHEEIININIPDPSTTRMVMTILPEPTPRLEP